MPNWTPGMTKLTLITLRTLQKTQLLVFMMRAQYLNKSI